MPPIAIRQYTCTYQGCTKTYTRKFNLDGHLRSHEQVKPWQCPECDTRFTRQNEWAKHMWTRHGPDGGLRFECEACGKTYADQSSLRRHHKSKPACYPGDPEPPVHANVMVASDSPIPHIPRNVFGSTPGRISVEMRVSQQRVYFDPTNFRILADSLFTAVNHVRNPNPKLGDLMGTMIQECETLALKKDHRTLRSTQAVIFATRLCLSENPLEEIRQSEWVQYLTNVDRHNISDPKEVPGDVIQVDVATFKSIVSAVESLVVDLLSTTATILHGTDLLGWHNLQSMPLFVVLREVLSETQALAGVLGPVQRTNFSAALQAVGSEPSDDLLLKQLKALFSVCNFLVKTTLQVFMAQVKAKNTPDYRLYKLVYQRYPGLVEDELKRRKVHFSVSLELAELDLASQSSRFSGLRYELQRRKDLFQTCRATWKSPASN